MARDATPRTRWSDLVEIGLPVAFFLVGVVLPLRWALAIDPDEGNNLMKALLLADGHRLYADIWSDQPPVMSYLLWGWLSLTGWTVEAGRLLVLLCSAVLLWSLHWTVRRTADRVAAAAACLLLVVSFGYLRISVAVMLAVPSLMFAMLAVQAAVAGGVRRRAAWPAVSGALLGLSVMTKLWTLLLVPAVLVAVILAQRGTGGSPRPWLRAGVFWLAGFALTVAAVLIAAVPAEHAGQLVGPHVDIRSAAGFAGNAAGFWRSVGQGLPFVLLGVVGLAGSLLRRNLWTLVPALWVALAAIALAGHVPLWYHHALLLAVPLAWGGSLAIAALVAAADERRRLPATAPPAPAPSPGRWARWSGPASVASRVVVAALTVVLAAGLPRVVATSAGRPDPADQALDRYFVALLRALGDETRLVVTDRQTLAFRAGLRVPPALAVTSLKRIHGGHLSLDEFIAVIQASAPEQILLSGRRVPLHPRLLASIERSHVLVFSDDSGARYYVTQGLAEQVPAAVEAAAAEVPECWQGQMNLAFLRKRQGRITEAVMALRQAQALAPTLRIELPSLLSPARVATP